MQNNIKKTLDFSLSLAKANFRLRNEGSYLGYVWYLLNPLAFFVILIFLKGSILSDQEIAHYPIYLIVGLIMYHFFNHTVGDSIGIIQSNGGLIKSVKVETEALVISRVIQSIFSHVFELALLAVFLIYFGINLGHILIYIPVYFVFVVFSLGLSFIFATLGVYFNDLRNIWGIFIQLLFFITPIFHLPPEGSLLEKFNFWNPISHFLEAGRETLIMGQVPSLSNSIIVLCLAIFSLLFGLMVFSKYKHSFAELV